MSVHAGASGAYGILLEDDETLAELLPLLNEIMADAEDPSDLEHLPQVRRLASRARKLLRASGVEVPRGARLLYTGSEDDQPGRCATAAETWVFGFGLYLAPHLYPKLHKTFTKRSAWHTWVWMG